MEASGLYPQGHHPIYQTSAAPRHETSEAHIPSNTITSIMGYRRIFQEMVFVDLY